MGLHRFCCSLTVNHLPRIHNGHTSTAQVFLHPFPLLLVQLRLVRAWTCTRNTAVQFLLHTLPRASIRLHTSELCNCVVCCIVPQVSRRVAQGRSNRHFARVETCTSIGACTRQRGRHKSADLLGSKPKPCRWTCAKCDPRCVRRPAWRHACRTWCRLPSKRCRTKRKNVVPSTLPKDFPISKSTDVWLKKPSKRCVAEATNTGACMCLETSKRT